MQPSPSLLSKIAVISIVVVVFAAAELLLLLWVAKRWFKFANEVISKDWDNWYKYHGDQQSRIVIKEPESPSLAHDSPPEV